MIPISECVDRTFYRVRAIDWRFGIYEEATQSFIGIRCKADLFLDRETHAEIDGTCIPLEMLEDVLPENISMEFSTENGYNHELESWIMEKEKKHFILRG